MIFFMNPETYRYHSFDQITAYRNRHRADAAAS